MRFGWRDEYSPDEAAGDCLSLLPCLCLMRFAHCPSQLGADGFNRREPTQRRLHPGETQQIKRDSATGSFV